jgi:hypothetical protein
MGWTQGPDDLDEEVYQSLPDFLKDQIADSPEFVAIRDAQARRGAENAANARAK